MSDSIHLPPQSSSPTPRRIRRRRRSVAVDWPGGLADPQRLSGGLTPAIRTCRPADHRRRARRWIDHLTGLVKEQVEFMAWLDSLRENLQDSATAEALRAICELLLRAD